MRKKLLLCFVLISVLGSVFALTGCNTEGNTRLSVEEEDMSEYYGCPNSKRVRKLMTERVKKMMRGNV